MGLESREIDEWVEFVKNYKHRLTSDGWLFDFLLFADCPLDIIDEVSDKIRQWLDG